MGPRIKDFTVKEIARTCGVTERQARRWRKGTLIPPPYALALLTGDLGFFSNYWKGWVIRGEYIVSPDQWLVRRNDALAVPLMHGQIAALRADLRAAKEAVELAKIGSFLEEQPTPDNWAAEGF